jgi:hypothetical protein
LTGLLKGNIPFDCKIVEFAQPDYITVKDFPEEGADCRLLNSMGTIDDTGEKLKGSVPR